MTTTFLLLGIARFFAVWVVLSVLFAAVLVGAMRAWGNHNG